MSTCPDQPSPGHGSPAWRARMRANPMALFWYRCGVGLAGLVCMVAALLTGWLPGPGGIPLFMLGLWIWSTEFVWAHRLMARVKAWVAHFQEIPPRRRRLLVTGCLLAALAFWYGWAAWQGIPQWIPDDLRAHIARLPLLED